MARLDIELEFLLNNKEYFEKNPSAGRLHVGPEDPIHIALTFSGDLAALEQAGFRVVSVGKNVAYGATNLDGLTRLANLSQVGVIQLQRKPHIHLNLSVPDIKANQVWSRSGDNFSGYTGRGVIVGIIDTGIDFTHKNFRKADADGTTRILTIWDQTLTQQGGETVPGPITDPNIASASHPTPLGYGVEYDAAQINDTLKNNKSAVVPVRHIDEHGHGTHVAGIAAGDGSQAGSCLVSYQYIGVAPEADIIVVRMFGLTSSDNKLPNPATSGGYLTDAIRYILNQAKTLNQAAVINLSLGLLTEFMDGTSPQCQDIDSLLVTNTQGRAIVFAAGNAGNAGFHANTTVPVGISNPVALNFQISPDTAEQSRTLLVRYTGSNLDAQLTSPVAGANGIISWVSVGAPTVPNTTANGQGGTVSITNIANSIRIQILSAAVSPQTSPPTFNKKIAGTWKLELRNTGATPTPVDVYCLNCDPNDAAAPRLQSNTVSKSTLSEEATGHEPVAVGSYKVGGELAASSSRGPTLDAAARTKPDICAPGVNITSAHSSDVTNDPDCSICCCVCCGAYVDKNGTSMAAPHIAGVIALMLHKDPNLTHTEITAALLANAAPKPADSSSDDNLGWGAGKTDAQATVGSAAVVAVNPPVAAQLAAAVAVSQPDPINAVRDRLLATERGAEFKSLLQMHFAEIRTLINTNRRVATAWHRCKGPVWVRLSLRAAYAPDAPLPMDAGGISLHEAIRRFANVLLRYGSTSFREDLRRYQPELSGISEGMSLSSLIHMFGNRHPNGGNINRDAVPL